MPKMKGRNRGKTTLLSITESQFKDAKDYGGHRRKLAVAIRIPLKNSSRCHRQQRMAVTP